MVTRENHHFYIDNASLQEVASALRVLSTDPGLSPAEIREIAIRDFYPKYQKDATYSPKRLLDLGLAACDHTAKPDYILTPTGLRLQSILESDQELAYELFHYLHYTGFAGHPEARKLLWSYRRCCQLFWSSGHDLDTKLVAATILSEAAERFPECLAGAGRQGGFNATAVQCVRSWLDCLRPSPLPPPVPGKTKGSIIKRNLANPSLAGLALDDLYRDRKIRYGDRVTLDDSVIDALSGVFFSTSESMYAGLVETAKRLPSLTLAETLSGVAIGLQQPFSLFDV